MTPQTTPDRLVLLLELAADSGHDRCLDCLARDRTQAGTLAAPPRDAGDPSPARWRTRVDGAPAAVLAACVGSTRRLG